MKRKDNFSLRNVGGEEILVPLGSQVTDMNGIVILNATGSYVWELLAGDCSLHGLATAVAERFDVDGESVRADIQDFVNELDRLGLLER